MARGFLSQNRLASKPPQPPASHRSHHASNHIRGNWKAQPSKPKNPLIGSPPQRRAASTSWCASRTREAEAEPHPSPSPRPNQVSLAHKLDEVGVAPLLLVAPPPAAAEAGGGVAGGSGGAPGAAGQELDVYREARRHTMEAQLAREPRLAKLEARVAVAAQARAEAEAGHSPVYLPYISPISPRRGRRRRGGTRASRRRRSGGSAPSGRTRLALGLGLGLGLVPNPHPHPNPNPNQGERKEEAEDACLVVARQVDKLKA